MQCRFKGGIWAPSGPVIDAQGNLYVTVGNGAVTQGSWDHTDSVLRLSPTLQLEDAFAPQSWQSDNASDLDLSSLGPVLLPNGLLFAQGKSNQGYLLHTDHLGGVGGNTVYSLDPSGGMLYALNATTGSVRASISVGTTSRFATPTLSQGSIFVGTMTGIVALRTK